MRSESSKTQLQSSVRTRKKPPPPTSTASHRRRRPMGPASCIIEWLKPDCLNPDKPKKTRPKNPYTSSAQSQASSAGGSNFISLEEHLSTSSPLIESGQPVSTRFPRPASKKPSPKRIHPSSSSVAAGGCGRRQRKGKGKSKSFTLEKLVKLDRELKEDHEFGSNRRSTDSVSRDEYEGGGGGGGSSMGPAGSQSCSRPEVMKKAKSVRFTLPGEGDIFVFYSPKTAVDRAFHSL